MEFECGLATAARKSPALPATPAGCRAAGRLDWAREDPRVGVMVSVSLAPRGVTALLLFLPLPPLLLLLLLPLDFCGGRRLAFLLWLLASAASAAATVAFARRFTETKFVRGLFLLMPLAVVGVNRDRVSVSYTHLTLPTNREV